MARRTVIPSVGLQVDTWYDYGSKWYKSTLSCTRCNHALRWRPALPDEHPNQWLHTHPWHNPQSPYAIWSEGPGSWAHDLIVREIKAGKRVYICPHCTPPASPEASTEATDEA